jgi:Leucine-rich repeat (LRR) protein
LQKLDLSGTQISTFPLEISQLTHLQSLDLGSTEIGTLPPEIGQYNGSPFTWRPFEAEIIL